MGGAELFFGKGNYFSYGGRPVFSRLIYPVPIRGGLGVHVTLDMSGRMRFGPDVEWVDEENYEVNAANAAAFYARIRDYWPALPDHGLVPDYSGIRPKLTGPDEPAADFMIDGPAQHGLPRLVHLFGMEFPETHQRPVDCGRSRGLPSSLNGIVPTRPRVLQGASAASTAEKLRSGIGEFSLAPGRCPLWVKSGHVQRTSPCPLSH